MKRKNLILVLLALVTMILIGAKIVFADTNTNAFHNFTGINLITTEVQKGEKVYMEFYGMEDITSVKINLVNKDKERNKFTVDLNDYKTGEAYFVMPDNAKEEATYQITAIEVSCEHGTVTYSTNEGENIYTNCSDNKYVKVIEPVEE